MALKSIKISELMDQSGVRFGTSGARGLVRHMTDEVCYSYAAAFIQYLESIDEVDMGSTIAIGGDLRASTDRIIRAVTRAVIDRGYSPCICGRVPSPALAYYGFQKGIPTIMVTGSHIPEDRNGIKFTRKGGEILKTDEKEIREQKISFPVGIFDDRGGLMIDPEHFRTNKSALDLYIERYISFFPEGCLKGKRLGVYLHSAVGRDLMVRILSDLGAEVFSLGYSDVFIPVDTEALRSEDVRLAKEWAAEYSFDAIVSTDGDSDRPLLADETGKWMRGDVSGILCAKFLEANSVVVPVSCNSALEKSGLFRKTVRTRIGSPYVIEGMLKEVKGGAGRVVGYEANGGFLTAGDMERNGRSLKALPTRDAIIVHLSLLLLSIETGRKISELVEGLPQRFTFSHSLKDFPTEKSRALLEHIYSGNTTRDREVIESIFKDYSGGVSYVDATDGIRIIFTTDEIVHLRPSGNAPEFRCYTEAETEARAIEMNKICLEIMEKWKE